MSYINKLNICFVFAILLNTKSNAQSINLFTLNNGGGYNNTMEWSIGESASIAHFMTSGYILNTGVLQPVTNIVTAINEYGPLVFGPEITIGPIPTSNLLYVKANFKASGNLSIQLIDGKSTIVLTHDAGFIFNRYEKDFLLNDFPSGVLYMKVIFKPLSGLAKVGIYKIIKL
jgi:hypothetical protein